MQSFKPQPGLTIEINKEMYRFLKHEGAVGLKNAVHAQTGAKGTVYHLQDSRGNDWALKVFLERYRSPVINTINHALRAYEYIPNVNIWKRTTLLRLSNSQLISQYPELEFAVLMPWVNGDNWQLYWTSPDDYELTPEQGLRLARHLSNSLHSLEQLYMAHCDLAGSNILIDAKTTTLQIIDIEDSYAPGIQPPSTLPRGTSGYQHRTSRQAGQWNTVADRFAGAILFAELICWHIDEVRAASEADSESYFTDRDLETPSIGNARFKVLLDALNTSSTDLGSLFKAAWSAPTLEQCPSLSAWDQALKQARVSSRSISLDVPNLQVEYSEHRVPVFSWTSVSHADTYLVQISSDIQFKQIITPTPLRPSKTGVNYTFYKEVEGVYFARVRAVAGKRESAWSKPRVFGNLDPVEIKQENQTDYVELSWKPVPQAKTYFITHRPPDGRSDKVIAETTTCFYRIDQRMLSPGSHTFGVFAHATFQEADGSIQSRKLRTVEISTVIPSPTELSVEIDGFNVELVWEAVNQASFYRVTYKKVKQSKQHEEQQDVTSPKLSLQLAPGEYTFKLVAYASSGATSKPLKQKVSVPPLQTPVTIVEQFKEKTTILWAEIPHATHYQVIIDGPTGNTVETVRQPKFDVRHKSTEVGMYRVNVQSVASVAGKEIVSSSSTPVEFSIRPPAPNWQPRKFRIEPGHLRLVWERIKDAERYRVYYRLATSQNDTLDFHETDVEFLDLNFEAGEYVFWITAISRNVQSLPSRQQLLTVPKLPSPNWRRTETKFHRVSLGWENIGEEFTYLLKVIQNRSLIAQEKLKQTEYELNLPPGTYTVALAACLDSRPEVISTWQEQVITTSLETPAIIQPTHVECESNYEVIWTEIPFANKYYLYEYGVVPNGRLRTSPIHTRISKTNQRTLLAEKAMCGKVFAFSVRAVYETDSQEILSEESNIYFIQFGSLPISLVPPTEIESRVSGDGSTVTWMRCFSATAYEYRYGMNSDLSSAIIHETTNCRLSLPVHAQYLQIRSIDSENNLKSDWSTVFTLPAIDIPLPRLRFDKIQYSVDVGLPIEIRWRFEGLSYEIQQPIFELQIDETSAFATPNSNLLTGYSYSLQLETPKLIYVRVRFVRGELAGEWSDTSQIAFTPPPPKDIKLTPSGRGVKVKWDSETTQEVEIQWSTDKRFTNPNTKIADAYTWLLVPSGTIHIRLRALFSTLYSSWSARQTVTVVRDPLETPLLQCIELQDSPNTYELQWTQVHGATHYIVQASNNELLISPEILWQGNETACQIQLGVGVHFVFVVATDGAISSQSEAFQVIVPEYVSTKLLPPP